MEADGLPFRGTYLRADIEWLLAHARVQEGRCYCAATDAEVRSQIQHRYRLRTEDTTVPYVLLPQVGDGELVTYTTLWCSACGMKQPENSEVRLTDLVYIVE